MRICSSTDLGIYLSASVAVCSSYCSGRSHCDFLRLPHVAVKTVVKQIVLQLSRPRSCFLLSLLSLLTFQSRHYGLFIDVVASSSGGRSCSCCRRCDDGSGSRRRRRSSSWWRWCCFCYCYYCCSYCCPCATAATVATAATTATTATAATAGG